MLQAENLQLNEDAAEYLRHYLTNLFECRDKYFGNARTVRSFMLDLIKKFHLRRAALSIEHRNESSDTLLTLDDVAMLNKEKEGMNFTRSSIGFRRDS